MMKLSRCIIRATGEIVPLPHPISIDEVRRKINARFLDRVRLHPHHYTMYVDDNGHQLQLEPNVLATILYWERCVPGTTHLIVGDVVILPDSDFPEEDDDV
jgi:hypothetical protein